MPLQNPTPSIIVVGSTNIDLITYTDRVPDRGETLVGRRFQMGFGGKGANQAVMAGLLGASVTMVNSLGDDAYGDMTLDNFAAFGIGTEHVARVQGSSGVAPIWVESDGTNRIIIVPGANFEMTPGQAVAAIDATADVDVVLGQLEIPQSVTAAGFETAHRRGATTVLNPAPAAELDPALLAASDWIIPNEIEFATLTGADATDEDACAEFATETGCRLVVTMGEAGVRTVTESGVVTDVPTESVTAVDTTGAGDAFVGAFSFGLAAGLDETTAARLGNACAAISVTKHGTQTSFPTPDHAASLLARVVG